MAIIKPDPKYQDLRMKLIKRINSLKMFDPQFDYNKIEWGMMMTGNNNYVGQLELTVREEYLEIRMSLDNICKSDREWAQEIADGYIKEFLGGYCDGSDYYELNSWLFIYSVDFAKLNLDDFFIRLSAMEKIINQKESKMIQHP